MGEDGLTETFQLLGFFYLLKLWKTLKGLLNIKIVTICLINQQWSLCGNLILFVISAQTSTGWDFSKQGSEACEDRLAEFGDAGSYLTGTGKTWYLAELDQSSLDYKSRRTTHGVLQTEHSNMTQLNVKKPSSICHYKQLKYLPGFPGHAEKIWYSRAQPRGLA